MLVKDAPSAVSEAEGPVSSLWWDLSSHAGKRCELISIDLTKHWTSHSWRASSACHEALKLSASCIYWTLSWQIIFFRHSQTISIGGFVMIIEEDKYDLSFPARATAQVMLFFFLFFFTLTSRLLFSGWVQLNKHKALQGKALVQCIILCIWRAQSGDLNQTAWLCSFAMRLLI